jgi:hypothetical protein
MKERSRKSVLSAGANRMHSSAAIPRPPSLVGLVAGAGVAPRGAATHVVLASGIMAPAVFAASEAYRSDIVLPEVPPKSAQYFKPCNESTIVCIKSLIRCQIAYAAVICEKYTLVVMYV